MRADGERPPAHNAHQVTEREGRGRRLPGDVAMDPQFPEQGRCIEVRDRGPQKLKRTRRRSL